MQNIFKIKDHGNLYYFLGIEVSNLTRASFYLRKYTLDILYEYGLIGSKPSKISIQKNLDRRDDNSKLLDDSFVYRRIIGKLIYLNITDITFVGQESNTIHGKIYMVSFRCYFHIIKLFNELSKSRITNKKE